MISIRHLPSSSECAVKSNQNQGEAHGKERRKEKKTKLVNDYWLQLGYWITSRIVICFVIILTTVSSDLMRSSIKARPIVGFYHTDLCVNRNVFLLKKLSNLPSFRASRALITSLKSTFEKSFYFLPICHCTKVL